MKTLFVNSRWVIVGYSIILVVSVFLSLKLGFNYEIARFFPDKDEDASFMAAFTQRIERDDTFLLVGIQHSRSIYDSTFLRKLNDLTKKSRLLPHILSASSVTNFREPVKTPLGLSYKKTIHIDEPERYSFDSISIQQDDRLYKSLVSEDHRAAVIVLRTREALSQTEAVELNDSLIKLVKSYSFKNVHIAGVANTQSIFVEKIKKEMLLYISLSILITAIILFILHRTFWGIIIPLSAVLASLLIFLAYLYLSGQSLDIMSSMYPLLIMIFGMSDLIHLQSKYIDELENGSSRFDAMLITFKETGKALFLTSFTTAIGFLSLITSSIPAIREFGINASVGVTIAYIIVVSFASSLLLQFDMEKLQRNVHQKQNWTRYNLFFYRIGKNKSRMVWTGTAILVVLSILGISRISTNTYLLSDIPLNSTVRQDFIFFENNFSGVRTFEIAIIPQKSNSIFNSDVLAEAQKLEEYLKDSIGLGSIQSPGVVIKSINKTWNGGMNSEYGIPESNDLIEDFGNLILKNKAISQFGITDSLGELGRITGRIRDSGSDSLSLLMSKTKNWIEQNIDKEIVQFQFTGSGLMVDKNNEHLRESLIQSLLFAFIVIGIMFSILFKDWKMLLVSVIPNIIPLLIAGAVLGYSDIELKAVTSIIFTISFGIAVDDTIHFLVRYKMQRQKGESVDSALKQTFLITGKAITLTTIVLVFGFISLIFSDFTGTYYVGIIVCITLVSGLFADLLLIPQLIYWINPNSRTDEAKNLSS